jgi:hypothetical protein
MGIMARCANVASFPTMCLPQGQGLVSQVLDLEVVCLIATNQYERPWLAKYLTTRFGSVGQCQQLGCWL